TAAAWARCGAGPAAGVDCPVGGGERPSKPMGPADDRGPDHLLSCARPLPARRRTVCMPGYQHKEGTMNGHIASQPRGRAWWPRAATAVAATLVTGLLAHQAIAQEVIASATFDVTSPEYVKWNKDTCLFEPAEGKGPYVAEVRKSEKP